MLDKCPFCGGKDLEIVDTVHKCKHIEILIIVLMDKDKIM